MRLLGKRVVEVKSLDAWIPLVPFSDWHLSARACDEPLIDEMVSWVARHPTALWCSLGDLANLIIPGDKRWNASEIEPKFYDMLKEGGFGGQLRDYVTNKIRRVKDRGLFMVSGNHEGHYDAFRDQAFTREIAKELDLPFGGELAAFDIIFTDGSKRIPYRIIARHGSSSATTPSGKLNVLLKFVASIDGGDLYLIGHMHDLMNRRIAKVYIDEPCKRFRHLDVRAAICGSTLKTFGEDYETYSEVKGYQPVPLGNPIIWIQPSTKKTRVED